MDMEDVEEVVGLVALLLEDEEEVQDPLLSEVQDPLHSEVRDPLLSEVQDLPLAEVRDIFSRVVNSRTG